ncbi:MAG: CobD/CbiB family protein [Betaproteobacteria bacterium]|nr:CobD/CbiB family protein [Betaproteobacteria bacterium]
MSLVTIILTLLLEQLRPVSAKVQVREGFARYADVLVRNFNAGGRRHGVLAWVAAVVPWVLVAQVGYALLDEMSTIAGLLWSIAVLYATLGLAQFNRAFGDVHEALRAGRVEEARALLHEWTSEDTADLSVQDLTKIAIEHGLLGAHRSVFGVIAWYVFLPAILGTLLPSGLGWLLAGPGGAVLYVLGATLNDRWGSRDEEAFLQFGRFSRDAFRFLDWLPSRVSALSFAIVGDFEDALYCWRSQAATWLDPAQGVVLASGAGALGVRLGDSLNRGGTLSFRPPLGVGDDADLEHMNGTVGLVWRALVLWMLVIALMTVASWVS